VVPVPMTLAAAGTSTNKPCRLGWRLDGTSTNDPGSSLIVPVPITPAALVPVPINLAGWVGGSVVPVPMTLAAA
jgi:hypothetical protein